MGEGIHTIKKENESSVDFSAEIEFTKLHQAHLDAHPWVREIVCLRKQAELIFCPIQPEDVFAGRIERLRVGIDPERGDLVEAAWFCRFSEIEEALDNPGIDEAQRPEIEWLLGYWKKHSTYFKCRSAFPEHIKRDMPSDDYYAGLQISFPMYGLGGPCLDYEKLVKIGIPGLRQEIKYAKRRAMTAKKQIPDSSSDIVGVQSKKGSYGGLSDVSGGPDHGSNNRIISGRFSEISNDEIDKAATAIYRTTSEFGAAAQDFENTSFDSDANLSGIDTTSSDFKNDSSDMDMEFLTALESALDIFKETALRYSEDARQMAWGIEDLRARERLLKIAESLEFVLEKPPETYHQAIQLVWLFSLHSLTRNYGRMDVYLGDLLANDLERGILTRDEALELTVGLWRIIVARGDNFNNRIIIGGRGRPNEKNADLFALLALEAQSIVNDAIPQLSVRWYEGMNPEILEKSIEVLATGSTMPIFYNDDVNIPGVCRSMEVSEKEGQQYGFYGCGEFLIDHQSIASPDAAINILKALDVTLRNGIDSFSGQKIGLDLGSLETYDNFENLKTAFARQIDYQMGMLADVQSAIYRETGKDAAFPFISMLYDDCIERGRALLSGGVRYKGATVESFGNNSAADALLAIQKTVFEDRSISPDHLLKCLEANFEGYETEFKLLRDVPKFGNDHAEADAMSVWVNNLVCESASRQKDFTPLDSFLVVLINNGDSVTLGRSTGASADGRLRGQPLSNGNQPSAGNDTNGVTAVLNSMARLDAGLHAGTTQNIKFARSLLKQHLQQVKALILAYFAQGGTQLMVTSTDRGELEAALENPDEFSHLFVRVGGYSERFIDLPRDIQQEVIGRTLY